MEGAQPRLHRLLKQRPASGVLGDLVRGGINHRLGALARGGLNHGESRPAALAHRQRVCAVAQQQLDHFSLTLETDSPQP